MGKKRIEKFTKIVNNNQRKVCLCKRKKGLLKKTIELSLLCDLKIFMFMYDPSQRRVTHFASHEDQDLLDLFNMGNQREFYSNRDYQRVGGSVSDLDSQYVMDQLSSPHAIDQTKFSDFDSDAESETKVDLEVKNHNKSGLAESACSPLVKK